MDETAPSAEAGGRKDELAPRRSPVAPCRPVRWYSAVVGGIAALPPDAGQDTGRTQATLYGVYIGRVTVE